MNRRLTEKVARYLNEHGMQVEFKAYDSAYHIASSPSSFLDNIGKGRINSTFLDAWLWLIDVRRNIRVESRDGVVVAEITHHEFPRMNRERPLTTGAPTAEEAVTAMITLITEFDLL